MSWEATLGNRLDRDTADKLVLKIILFAHRHRLDLEADPEEDRPAILWERLMHAIPLDSPQYRNAVRLLNRAITGEDGTYWQSLWHDAAHPHRPQPMRYLKGRTP